ncbi:MAG TPA: hypothetical protein VM536_20260, partial [Chloroflexia bacterium]|nr:hypothetical protein [Chloroflexia bacterium]
MLGTAGAARLVRSLALVLLLLTAGCMGEPETPPTAVLAGSSPVPTAAPPTRPPPTETEILPASAVPSASAVASSPGPTLTMTSVPPTPTNPLLSSTLAAMDALQTYHYTTTVQTFDDAHKFQSASEGDYVAPGGLQWMTTVEGITTTAVLTGNLYYVAVSGQAWTPLPGGAVERQRQLPWRLLNLATDVLLVSRDPPTDPDPVIRMSFTLPTNALPPESHSWKVVEGEVWIGQSDYRVRAFKLFAQDPTHETTTRFFLSAYDEPVQ